MASVPYELEGDKSSGFILDPNERKRVGYVTQLKVLAIPFAPDLDLRGDVVKDGIDVMVYQVSMQVAPGANQQYSLAPRACLHAYPACERPTSTVRRRSRVTRVETACARTDRRQAGPSARLPWRGACQRRRACTGRSRRTTERPPHAGARDPPVVTMERRRAISRSAAQRASSARRSREPSTRSRPSCAAGTTAGALPPRTRSRKSERPTTRGTRQTSRARSAWTRRQG